MDLNRLSSSDEESPPLTPPAQPAQATPSAPNASADQTLPQPRYPPQPPHPPSTAQQPPQSSGSLLCQELLSVCNNDYAAQQLGAARKTSEPLTPMSPPGQNARLLAPPTTSGSAGASKPDPVQLKLQAGLLQAGVPEAKRVRQVKAAERLQPKISPPAPDVLKMLQVPRADSAESVGQPGDFRVKLALTVCSAEPVADCGTCVFCLDKPKFGGAGTKRQSCVLRRTTPTGLARVWTPLRVVSTQYLQQLEAYTSQVPLDRSFLARSLETRSGGGGRANAAQGGGAKRARPKAAQKRRGAASTSPADELPWSDDDEEEADPQHAPPPPHKGRAARPPSACGADGSDAGLHRQPSNSDGAASALVALSALGALAALCGPDGKFGPQAAPAGCDNTDREDAEEPEEAGALTTPPTAGCPSKARPAKRRLPAAKGSLSAAKQRARVVVKAERLL